MRLESYFNETSLIATGLSSLSVSRPSLPNQCFNLEVRAKWMTYQEYTGFGVASCTQAGLTKFQRRRPNSPWNILAFCKPTLTTNRCFNLVSSGSNWIDISRVHGVWSSIMQTSSFVQEGGLMAHAVSLLSVSRHSRPTDVLTRISPGSIWIDLS